MMDNNKHFHIVNTKVGKCGTLVPDGSFIECEYGEHRSDLNTHMLYALAKTLFPDHHRRSTESMYEYVTRMGFITMGSRGPGKEVFSHILVHSKTQVSNEQIAWFNSHFYELDEMQQSDLKSVLKERLDV